MTRDCSYSLRERRTCERPVRAGSELPSDRHAVAAPAYSITVDQPVDTAASVASMGGVAFDTSTGFDPIRSDSSELR